LSAGPLATSTRAAGSDGGPARPVVVVLAARWSGDAEAAWFTRQVARSLLRRGDVHVVTLEGAKPAVSVDHEGTSAVDDGARCTVHRLAVAPAPRLVARREVLLAALSTVEARSGRPTGPSVDRLLREGASEPWAAADESVLGLRPDLVVLAGYRQVGAFDLWGRVVPDTPLVFVPLADFHPAVGLAHFDPIFDRASATLVATGSEYRAVTELCGPIRRDPGRIHRVGLPATIEPAARADVERHPSDAGPGGGEADSGSGVVMFTGCGADDHDRAVALARLAALAFPRVRVTVVSTDALDVWFGGERTRSPVPEGASAVLRLMGGAAMTVDLRPGALFARRCIDSLLCGTPVVVPADSRARQHAESGAGGLWFSSPGELIWCVEAMLEPDVRRRLGAQGKRYADAEFASTPAFVDRVEAVIGRVGAR